MPSIEIFVGPLSLWWTTGPCRANALDITDREVVRGAVESWRHWLSKPLLREGLLPEPLHWDESAAEPTYLRRIDAGADAALRYLAAIAEEPRATWPESLPALAVIGAALERLETTAFELCRFATIAAPCLWLPGRFDAVFLAQDLNEEQIWIGSLYDLCSALHDLERHLEKTDTPLAAAAREAMVALATAAESARRAMVPLRIGGRG